MRNTSPRHARLEELRAMLDAYRFMTVEEVEASGWGDMQIELEGEVWRIEQDQLHEGDRHPEAA